MKDQVSKIQEIINQKATNKLKEDITSIARVLQNGLGHDLLEGIEVKITKDGKEKVVALRWILSNGNLQKEVFDANLPKYIEKETEAFVKQVESLREDVDQLMNNY